MKTGPVLTTILALYIGGISLLALPARKGPVKITQPDGTSFMARLKGDEFAHILTTVDGCAVIRDEDGYYNYAYYDQDGIRHSSGYVVGRDVPGMVRISSRDIPFGRLGARGSSRRQAAMKLRRAARPSGPGTKAQGTQTRRCLVIPAEFSDKGFDYGREHIHAMLNEKGYSFNGATGSVGEYFEEQFLGTCKFEYTVSSTVTLLHEESYYGADSGEEIDVKAYEAIIEACKAADSEIDFSVFDNDSDGFIDNVFVIVPGKDQTDNGEEDLIWSHQWYILDGAGQTVVLDGKTLNSYAISTELRRTNTIGADGEYVYGFTGIGPFCHEFGHTLGLVDMYDTDLSDDGGGGRASGHFSVTSLMDGGAYNNGSRTPPYFNAVDRDMLGIGSPETLKAGSYTLEPISEKGRYLRINSKDPDEYYLIECRGYEAWDSYVGGSGLGIYHIDKTDRPAGFSDSQNRVLTAKERWYGYNEVNCLPDRQCGGMVPADPDAFPIDAEGYLVPDIATRVFWPHLSYTAFTPHTNPAFTFYGDDSTPVPSPLMITDIQRHGRNVTFNVRIHTDDGTPSPINLKFNTFQDAIIITWEVNDADWYGPGFIEWKTGSGDKNLEEVNQYENGKYSFTITGLSPQTTVDVEVFFKYGETEGPRAGGSPRTNPLSAGYPYIYLNNIPRNSDGSFPSGTGLPLRVFNAQRAEEISWYYGTRAVSTDMSGFFHPASSGILKAVIVWDDGTSETISKYIEINQ